MTRRWSSRYPPLAGGAIALALATFVLPSSLNTPQTNPTETLEYAPVPPADDDAPPPAGNASSLGLGSSGSISNDGAGGSGPGLPPPGIPPGAGSRPSTKRCVGSPPRQTEDPLSPPCVAFFEGDNGGATYHGVSRNEIRVMIYLDGSTTVLTEPSSDTDESKQSGKCFDLGKPATDDAPETITPINMRRFQRYFNDRYQTYGRTVRFIVCFSPTNDTAETRRAEAAAHLAKYKPFAVIQSQIRDGYAEAYTEAMAQRGVLSFGSAGGSRSARFYQRYPGLIWSYLPSVEEQAQLFAAYVCNKVVGKPVVDSGNPETVGKPRVLGYLHTTDQANPGLVRLAELARKRIEKCGGRFAATATFPHAGYVQQSNGSDPSASYAAPNMAAFQNAKVTTIIWPGGYETDQSRAADRLRYYPEVVLAGDGLIDGNTGGTYQAAEFWRHAWVATQQVLITDAKQDRCAAALREADPSTPNGDATRVCSFPYYPDLRQLFTGIQVAGPRLTRASLDQGFHAIPGVPSNDPRVAACFYSTNDYTCVKDAMSEHWDPEGTWPGQRTPGCWRIVDGARRHTAGTWDHDNINARYRRSDTCNSYSSTPLLY